MIYTHPQAANVLADVIAKGRKKIVEYIRTRQETGHFRNDIDPVLFVQMMAATFAMRAIARGFNDLLPLAHVSREEIINQLVSLLLYGIVQRDSAPRDEIVRASS